MGIDSLVERDREIVIRPVETSAMDKQRLTNRLGGAVRFTQNSVRLRLLELSLLGRKRSTWCWTRSSASRARWNRRLPDQSRHEVKSMPGDWNATR
jgi:hypothetical protein